VNNYSKNSSLGKEYWWGRVIINEKHVLFGEKLKPGKWDSPGGWRQRSRQNITCYKIVGNPGRAKGEKKTGAHGRGNQGVVAWVSQEDLRK